MFIDGVQVRSAYSVCVFNEGCLELCAVMPCETREDAEEIAAKLKAQHPERVYEVKACKAWLH